MGNRCCGGSAPEASSHGKGHRHHRRGHPRKHRKGDNDAHPDVEDAAGQHDVPVVAVVTPHAADETPLAGEEGRTRVAATSTAAPETTPLPASAGAGGGEGATTDHRRRNRHPKYPKDRVGETDAEKRQLADDDDHNPKRSRAKRHQRRKGTHDPQDNDNGDETKVAETNKGEQNSKGNKSSEFLEQPVVVYVAPTQSQTDDHSSASSAVSMRAFSPDGDNNGDGVGDGVPRVHKVAHVVYPTRSSDAFGPVSSSEGSPPDSRSSSPCVLMSSNSGSLAATPIRGGRQEATESRHHRRRPLAAVQHSSSSPTMIRAAVDPQHGDVDEHDDDSVVPMARTETTMHAMEKPRSILVESLRASSSAAADGGQTTTSASCFSPPRNTHLTLAPTTFGRRNSCDSGSGRDAPVPPAAASSSATPASVLTPHGGVSFSRKTEVVLDVSRLLAQQQQQRTQEHLQEVQQRRMIAITSGSTYSDDQRDRDAPLPLDPPLHQQQHSDSSERHSSSDHHSSSHNSSHNSSVQHGLLDLANAAEHRHAHELQQREEVTALLEAAGGSSAASLNLNLSFSTSQENSLVQMKQSLGSSVHTIEDLSHLTGAALSALRRHNVDIPSPISTSAEATAHDDHSLAATVSHSGERQLVDLDNEHSDHVLMTTPKRPADDGASGGDSKRPPVMTLPPQLSPSQQHEMSSAPGSATTQQTQAILNAQTPLTTTTTVSLEGTLFDASESGATHHSQLGYGAGAGQPNIIGSGAAAARVRATRRQNSGVWGPAPTVEGGGAGRSGGSRLPRYKKTPVSSALGFASSDSQHRRDQPRSIGNPFANLVGSPLSEEQEDTRIGENPAETLSDDSSSSSSSFEQEAFVEEDEKGGGTTTAATATVSSKERTGTADNGGTSRARGDHPLFCASRASMFTPIGVLYTDQEEDAGEEVGQDVPKQEDGDGFAASAPEHKKAKSRENAVGEASGSRSPSYSYSPSNSQSRSSESFHSLFTMSSNVQPFSEQHDPLHGSPPSAPATKESGHGHKKQHHSPPSRGDGAGSREVGRGASSSGNRGRVVASSSASATGGGDIGGVEDRPRMLGDVSTTSMREITHELQSSGSIWLDEQRKRRQQQQDDRKVDAEARRHMEELLPFVPTQRIPQRIHNHLHRHHSGRVHPHVLASSAPVVAVSTTTAAAAAAARRSHQRHLPTPRRDASWFGRSTSHSPLSHSAENVDSTDEFVRHQNTGKSGDHCCHPPPIFRPTEEQHEYLASSSPRGGGAGQQHRKTPTTVVASVSALGTRTNSNSGVMSAGGSAVWSRAKPSFNKTPSTSTSNSPKDLEHHDDHHFHSFEEGGENLSRHDQQRLLRGPGDDEHHEHHHHHHDHPPHELDDAHHDQHNEEDHSLHVPTLSGVAQSTTPQSSTAGPDTTPHRDQSEAASRQGHGLPLFSVVSHRGGSALDDGDPVGLLGLGSHDRDDDLWFCTL